MSFSKKVVTNNTSGGSNITGDQWDTWNEYNWGLLDVKPVTQANGREVKEADYIGILNYIQELGVQPQEDASTKSDLPAPTGDEENSPEELEKIKQWPTNYFKWVTKYKGGVATQERHICWPKEPEEELVLAVDFPELKVNYGLFPSADGTESIKPLRVDYNGKFKQSFQRNVTNEVNWKTNKFSDKDIKYKIASACGNLEEYQNDQHDLAHLVQATCMWTIRMTKNKSGENTYYKTEIFDPAPIQDIKTRKEVYTVAEQIEDASCDVEFCGILFNGGDYPDENLLQVCDFWWDKAQQAVEFDKNEGTTRDGEWLKGCFWDDSDLGKAYTKFKGKSGSESASSKPKTSVKEEPKQTPIKAKEPVKPKEEVQEEFDFSDDIPFAPLHLLCPLLV